MFWGGDGINRRLCKVERSLATAPMSLLSLRLISSPEGFPACPRLRVYGWVHALMGALRLYPLRAATADPADEPSSWMLSKRLLRGLARATGRALLRLLGLGIHVARGSGDLRQLEERRALAAEQRVDRRGEFLACLFVARVQPHDVRLRIEDDRDERDVFLAVAREEHEDVAVRELAVHAEILRRILERDATGGSGLGSHDGITDEIGLSADVAGWISERLQPVHGRAEDRGWISRRHRDRCRVWVCGRIEPRLGPNPLSTKGTKQLEGVVCEADTLAAFRFEKARTG